MTSKLSFAFGGDSEAKTPQELERKRALVDSLLAQQAGSASPRNFGEGLSALGKAWMTRQARQSLEKDESNVQSGQDALSPILAAALAGQGISASSPAIPSSPQTGAAPMVGQTQPAIPTTIQAQPIPGGTMSAPAGGSPFPTAGAMQNIAQPQPQGIEQIGDTPQQPQGTPVGPVDPTTGQSIQPNLPPALGGQPAPVTHPLYGGDPNAAQQMPQGAASGQLAALLSVASDPRFQFASPAKQSMVLKQIELIQARNNPAPTADIQEFEYAKQTGYQGSFADWQTMKRAANGGKGQYGLTPQYAVDQKTGKQVILQVGSDGTSIRTPLPEGVELSNKAEKIDLGTSWGILDPITRQMVGTIPKDVAGEASATAGGKISGDAKASLGAARIGVNALTQRVDEIINDKGLGSITGYASILPNMLSTQSMVELRGKINELKGKGFLEARQALKGAGQITDYEGAKAESALADLDTAIQSGNVEAVKGALVRFKDSLNTGLEKMSSLAGETAPQNTAPPPGTVKVFNPATGKIE